MPDFRAANGLTELAGPLHTDQFLDNVLDELADHADFDGLVDRGVAHRRTPLASPRGAPPETTGPFTRATGWKRPVTASIAGNVQEVHHFTNYKWVWVEELQMLIRVCCENTLLEINDGQSNPLTVDVEAGTPYTTS